MNLDLIKALLEVMAGCRAVPGHDAYIYCMNTIDTNQQHPIVERDLDLTFEGYKCLLRHTISRYPGISSDDVREIEEKAMDAYFDKKKELSKKLLRSKDLLR